MDLSGSGGGLRSRSQRICSRARLWIMHCPWTCKLSSMMLSSVWLVQIPIKLIDLSKTILWAWIAVAVFFICHQALNVELSFTFLLLEKISSSWRFNNYCLVAIKRKFTSFLGGNRVWLTVLVMVWTRILLNLRSFIPWMRRSDTKQILIVLLNLCSWPK